MFKAVKWGGLIVMVMLVFLNKTTHAMFRVHHGKNPVSTEHQIKQQHRQTPATGDFSAGSSKQAAQTKKRVAAVKALDEQAKKWDYTDCNWVDTYCYFSTYISAIDFIKATHSGYESIEYLAQALLDSEEFYSTTIAVAKFFVYSVLSARYNDYIIDTSLTRSPSFFFLQHADEIIQPYQPVSVTFIPIKYNYGNSLLSFYEKEFILNPDISNLKLANSLSELITIINLRAGVYSDSTQVHSELDDRYPTVQQILDYYPGEKCAVFAFLVNYPLELEQIKTLIGIKLMQPEKNLKQKISQVFIQLWKDKPDDSLAQLAIVGFGFNPLRNDSAAISHSSANWEELNHQLVMDVFISSYDKFIKILNSTRFSGLLLAHGIINPTDYSSIMAPGTTQQSKNIIILDGLLSQKGTDFVEAFKKLLRIMEDKGSANEKKLAQEIYSELQQ